MGSFYKKALGFGALGAAAGAVAYYLKKQKEKTLSLKRILQIFMIISKKPLPLPQTLLPA